MKIKIDFKTTKKVKNGEKTELKFVDNPLFVEVKLLDTKMAFGTKLHLVTPLKGSGEVWVRDVIE